MHRGPEAGETALFRAYRAFLDQHPSFPLSELGKEPPFANFLHDRFWPVYDYNVLKGSYEHPYTEPKGPLHIVSGSAVTPFCLSKDPYTRAILLRHAISELRVVLLSTHRVPH